MILVSDGFSPRQLTKLLWALVLLGLFSSGAIAIYVGWSLAVVADRNAVSRSTHQKIQLNLEQLHRLSTEAFTLNQKIVLGEGEQNPLKVNPALDELEIAISTMDQEFFEAEMTNALKVVSRSSRRDENHLAKDSGLA